MKRQQRWTMYIGMATILLAFVIFTYRHFAEGSIDTLGYAVRAGVCLISFAAALTATIVAEKQQRARKRQR